MTEILCKQLYRYLNKGSETPTTYGGRLSFISFYFCKLNKQLGENGKHHKTQVLLHVIMYVCVLYH